MARQCKILNRKPHSRCSMDLENNSSFDHLQHSSFIGDVTRGRAYPRSTVITTQIPTVPQVDGRMDQTTSRKSGDLTPPHRSSSPRHRKFECVESGTRPVSSWSCYLLISSTSHHITYQVSRLFRQLLSLSENDPDMTAGLANFVWNMNMFADGLSLPWVPFKL